MGRGPAPLAFALALGALAVTTPAAAQSPADAGDGAVDGAVDAAADADASVPDDEDDDVAEAPSDGGQPADVAPPPVTFGPLESFDLAEGIQVTVQAPSDWTATDGDVQIPDLDQVPGAQLKVSRSWTPKGKPRGRLFLVCASAPSRDWAHGLESVVFERMNGIANTELARYMTVASFTSSAMVDTSFGYQQDFLAHGEGVASLRQGGVRVLEAEDGTRRKSPHMSVAGRHSLAFSLKEAEPAVLTCSLACVEPSRRAGTVCATALGTHRIVGETGPEPIPTLKARFVLGFSRRPAAMAGVAAGLLALLIGVAAVVRGLLLSPRA